MTQTTIRLSSPLDVIQSVPSLLGYVPGVESVVVIAVVDTKVAFTSRFDVDAAFDALPTVASAAHQAGATALFVVVFVNEFDLNEWRDWVDAVMDVTELPVRDALLVSSSRYWSLMCEDPDCCPPEGTPIDGATGVALAEFVAAGVAPSGSRESIVTRLADAAPTVSVEQVDAADEALPDDPLEQVQAGFRALEEGDAATLAAVCLRSLTHRDAVMLSILDGEFGLAQQAVELAATLPGAARSRVASLACLALVATGDWGPRLEAALGMAGGESATRLVSMSVKAGLPPEQIRDVFLGTRDEVLERLAAA